MDEIKESLSWLDSVKAALYERVSSPFLGTFSAAWVAWNYKLLFVLFFSGYDTDYKFQYIETFLYPTHEILRDYFIWHPLLTVLAFFVAYPIPSLIAYAISDITKVALKIISLKIRNIKPVDQKQVRLLYTQLSELETSRDNVISENKNIIDALKQTVEEKELRITQLADEVKSYNSKGETEENINEINNTEIDNEYIDELNDNNLIDKFKSNFNRASEEDAIGILQRFVLLLLKDYETVPSKILEDSLLKISDKSRLWVEKYLGELERKHLIFNNGGFYGLNSAGKDYLLSNRLDNISFKNFMNAVN